MVQVVVVPQQVELLQDIPLAELDHCQLLLGMREGLLVLQEGEEGVVECSAAEHQSWVALQEPAGEGVEEGQMTGAVRLAGYLELVLDQLGVSH